MGTQSISLKLDKADIERLRTLAGARNRTPHYLMREAVREYLRREEARSAFLAEAVEAWRDYRETRVHATLEEVDGWLSAWGTDGELAAGPECHE